MVEKSRRTRRKRKISSQSQGSKSGGSKEAKSGGKVVSLSSRRRRPKATSNKLRPKTNLQKAASPSGTKQASPQRKTRRRPTAKSSRSNNQARRLRLKLPKPILYPIRFAIVGIGIGAFIGTLLAISNSRPYISVTQDTEERSQSFAPDESANPLPLETSLVTMRESVQVAIAADPELDATMLFVDLDTGEYLDVASSRSISAASTIKIPVLVAFLEAVDQGTVQLQDSLIITDNVKGGGSGNFQYKDNGTELSALFVASEMSINSDNTATNMIIEQLGGFEVLNQKFQSWGLQQTQLNAPLPDLEGTNLTTARDLAFLLAKISRGDILSNRSRDRLIRIMSSTRNDNLLPQTLGQGAAIAHKTGDIGYIIGDAGIIDLPNGKRYIASIFVERPYDAPKGKELLHKIGKLFYQHAEKNQPQPIPTEPQESDKSLETASFPEETN
ncbi:beta-lactamase, putative [[Leptolyngbya] sp. PCC 7376]|uniref:serine hydrolase n=1 Tax=[Leptolyngbya] sp. PCC 7376 TaxID=111781 RepID=UPI00029F1E01|nr:serine hydrolase [[Leptolyngbya] sp. PCC 7376]AFY40506.1 beta-lactamase, putative [[Leptolyngbya] sp. PCC 7376]